MSKDILKAIGLNNDEVEMYLSLIETGAQTASEVSNRTGIARTYIYDLARQLSEKNLVNIVKSGKITKFSAKSPDYLSELAVEQTKQSKQAETFLSEILGELKSKYASVEHKPLITYYEGVAGIKKAYLRTLEANETIMALVGVTKPHPEVWNWLRTVYIHKRIEAGISAHVIVPKSEKQEEYTKVDDKELRITKVVPPQIAPIEHEINIFNDTLAILNAKEGEEPLGIFIQNPVIVNSFKAWFQLTWSRID